MSSNKILTSLPRDFSLNLFLDLNKYLIIIFRLKRVSLHPFIIMIDKIILTKIGKLICIYNVANKAVNKANMIKLFKALIKNKDIIKKIIIVVKISINQLL